MYQLRCDSLHKQLGSLDEVSQCAYVLAISCDCYDT